MRADPGGGRLLITLTDPSSGGAFSACVAALQAAGHLVRPCESLEAAGGDLDEADCEAIVVVIGDQRGERRKVAELLSRCQDIAPAVIAGVPAGAAARAMVAAGAWITVADPFDTAELERAVARALRHGGALRRESRFDPAEPLSRLLGVSEGIAEIERLVAHAAASQEPVLVVGEPGSGKHVVAQAVHAHRESARRSGPFVKCLLGGIDPGDLSEDLYGTDSRPGPFERAHGGTLFIGEVDLLPRLEQARLLELLDQGPRGAVTRADDSATVPADFRLIAAAAAPLDEPQQRARLNEELYYRISVLPIRIPPLRRRVEDIPVLAGTLIDRCAGRRGRTLVGLSPRAVAILQRYHWPGNVRELEEHIGRAVRRAAGPVIEAEDLAELAHMTAGRPEAPPSGTLDISLSLEDSLPLTEVARRAAAAAEVVAIRRALRLTSGNITRSAKLLKVSRLHLQGRMKKYGLRESK